ncbi:efflux RND transporter periplasmic adaptor subunit [Mesoterricola sediminis]|uniref:MexX family efflux pump subunit n=1 Tax=Mesoterricola sediminis TaxID=2927980 RepID=A0AA48GW96_9BACT|nr:efflux RND transporter periplasmic adaptor subunit [Mesoterricola sediminis]BDU75570.1 MexX family efflux pump subunit [Mesoterricola sediminis]
MRKGWIVNGLAGGAVGIAALLGCKSAPPPAMTSEVAFVVIQPRKAALTTELPGRTAPYQVAEVRPQVNGLIQKRLFEEGTDVKEGAVLYQIDPVPYQAALDQAKATLAAAQANLPAIRARAERTKGLAEAKAVGQQEADEAQAAFLQAQAAVAAGKAAVSNAEFNLANTPIKAPIQGRAGKSSVTVGALVTAYQPASLVTVTRLDPIYVDVTQSSAELLRLRKRLEGGKLHSGDGARKAKLILEDGTPYQLEGRLQFRDVTVDPSTGAVTLRMVFPNPKQVLLPGMFVRAILEDGVDDQAILAPQQGISRDAKGNAIALVLDASNRIEQRIVNLDRALGDSWVVQSGLNAGDRLVVEGIQKVRPGMTVKAVPFAPAAQPAGAQK